jgi:hypothetical protein
MTQKIVNEKQKQRKKKRKEKKKHIQHKHHIYSHLKAQRKMVQLFFLSNLLAKIENKEDRTE